MDWVIGDKVIVMHEKYDIEAGTFGEVCNIDGDKIWIRTFNDDGSPAGAYPFDSDDLQLYHWKN